MLEIQLHPIFAYASTWKNSVLSVNILSRSCRSWQVQIHIIVVFWSSLMYCTFSLTWAQLSMCLAWRKNLQQRNHQFMVIFWLLKTFHQCLLLSIQIEKFEGISLTHSDFFSPVAKASLQIRTKTENDANIQSASISEDWSRINISGL